MGNILGLSSDKFVVDQIKIRQQKLGITSGIIPDDILSWTNGKTAWLRLVSSVDVNKDGGKIAKENILFGGTTKYTPPTFVNPGSSDNKDSIVGIKAGLSAYDNSSFGYRPMAAIMGADISYLNSNGSLKKAVINIKAYSPEQLDIIDKLYMRPGYSCLLEWGHTIYLNNKGEKTNFDNFSTLPFLEMISNGTSPEKVKEAIKNEQTKHDGNYEAFYGEIIKFNWKFNASDSTYDINIELISEGNVVESLLLSSTLGQNEDTNDANDKKNPDEPSIIKLKNASKFYRFLYEIYKINITSTPTGAITALASTGVFGLGSLGLAALYNSFNNPKQSNEIKSLNLEKLKTSYDIKSSLYNTGFSYPFKIEDDFLWFDKNETQRYISLGLLLEYINNNHNIFYKNNNDKKLSIDTGENNYCLTHPYHVASDPRICFISLPGNYSAGLPNEVKKFRTDNPFLGNVMYIQYNISYITKILYELKNKDGRTPLYDFLNRLLDDTNICLGSINKLSFKILNDNVITIIDEVSLPYKEKKEKKEYAKFNVYGVRPNEGSFIKNIDFNVTITNDMATAISIGAQANGNQPGINSTAFSEFNKGLIDRVTIKSVLEENLLDDGETEEERKQEQEKQNNIAATFVNNANAIYIEKFINDIYVENLSNVNSDFCNLIIGKATEKQIIPAPFFLPFDLNLTMMGLSGIKIFEKFALTEGSEKILPSYYRDNNGKSLIDFIVFDLKHSIKDNKWETTIKGKSIPSETNLVETQDENLNIIESNLEDKTQEVIPSTKTLKQIIIDAGYPENTSAFIFALSIGTKEGWNPKANGGIGSRSYRNNNPGNLVYDLRLQSIDSGVKLEKNPYGINRFAAFSTAELGVKALVENKLKRWAKGYMPITRGNTIEIEQNKAGNKYIRGNSPTIAQFVYTYAPPSDGNNTENYIKGLLSDIIKIKSDTTRTTSLNNFF